jgi:beta-phosphoglucomutase
MIDAVIFDMDGVLMDTVEVAYQAKAKILREKYGVDITTIPDPHNEAHRGSSVRTFLAALKKSHGKEISEAEFASYSTPAIKAMLQELNTKADPGLLSFLDELQRKDVPLAIASSGLKQSVANKLELLGIEGCFQTVVTAHDVERHKPHPDGYLLAMERLHADPARTIIFEDSLAGLTSGLASGAAVIGITKFNSQPKTLADADLIINDWPEVNYRRLVDLLAQRKPR